MSTRMKTWLAKAKGLGKGDNNPLLINDGSPNDEKLPDDIINQEETKENVIVSDRKSRRQTGDYQQLQSSIVEPRIHPQIHNPLLSVASPQFVRYQSTHSTIDNGTGIKLPEDLFLYSLSFLANNDLCCACLVCISWKNCVYDPVLWRRLHLSHYCTGAHDYLLSHILNLNRFDNVLSISLANCSALTDQSLLFLTQKCALIRVLYLTNCYRLTPKMIYLTVQKLQHLHKLELYGVISSHNKYYHIQQLQQLTFFLNELGIETGNFANNANNNANNNNNNRARRGAQRGAQNNNAPNNGPNANNNNEDNPEWRNAQQIANEGDDADAANNPAAAPNNAAGEANIVDNPPSLNNRIQRVRLMICLAKAIKNCRPWIDLGLFWMQILSMVGRNDPLMILNIDEYEALYNVRNQMSNSQFMENSLDDSNEPQFMFNGSRYLSLYEYRLYQIQRELQLQALRDNNNNANNNNHNDDDDLSDDDDEDDQKRESKHLNNQKRKKKKKKKKKSIMNRVDMDFELDQSHEWMRSSSPQSNKALMSINNRDTGNYYEMHTLGNDDDNEDGYNGNNGGDVGDVNDGFYPTNSRAYISISGHHNLEFESETDGLFAFDKLAVERLQNHFNLECNRLLPLNLTIAKCRYSNQFQGGCWGRVIGRIIYSNVHYSEGGNYPFEVLFSCQSHSDEDLTDASLFRCQSCDRLFRKDSMMRNSLICKTCYDSKKLQEKCIWVKLNKKGLQNFSFAHVCQNTLSVADRRNLPKTLKSYGKVKAQLTYHITDPAENNNENNNENDGNEPLNELRRRRVERLEDNAGGDDANNNNNNRNDAGDDDEDIDYSKIAISTFWNNNETRISFMMDKFTETLKKAQSRCATRAILVYCEGNDDDEDDNDNANDEDNRREHERKDNNDGDGADGADAVDDADANDDDLLDENSKYIEILADPGVLFDGLDGVDFMYLTVSAWTQFVSILLPMVFSIICTIYFLYELNTFNYKSEHLNTSSSANSENAIYLPDAPSNAASSNMYLFYALGAFLLLIIGAFIAYRFQRRCEQVFRAFLVLDIFLILLIGSAILAVICCANYNIFSIDIVSFCLVIFNFGVVGVTTFYCDVAPILHRIFLVLLNAIMSIMITSAIGWYVLFLLLILVAADVIAMIRPSFGRMFSPFLVPTSIQLPNTTPKIFYQVYGLRVRAPEFMFYALMLGLIDITNYTQVVLLFMALINSFVITVFVAPFFSKQIRPLPVSFACLAVVLFHFHQIFGKYQRDNVWTLVVP